MQTVAGESARAALEGDRRHEIDGWVLKVAESNSMSSTANSGTRGGGRAGAARRGHDRDRDKERSIIRCINRSR